MALVNEKNEILLELAAKEGRYEEDAEQTGWSVSASRRKTTPVTEMHRCAQWHVPFVRTQHYAREFAVQFGAAVKKRYRQWYKDAPATSSYPLKAPPGLPAELPTIEFIECDIYVLGTGSERRSYFVEAMLTGEWRKFNTNAGGVWGISKTQTTTQTTTQTQTQGAAQQPLNGLGQIAEGEEDDDSDDESGETNPMARSPPAEGDIPSALPQAFTHWSYSHSNGKRMVCDLQGTSPSLSLSPSRPPVGRSLLRLVLYGTGTDGAYGPRCH